MDYEKEYNEVFKRAKELHEAGNALTKKQMEIVFPELAESEDERIRREIIDFIQWAEDRGMTRHDYHQAKRPAAWITYLEKQKEPHYTKRNALFDKCVENCDPEIMKRVSDEIDAMLEKEQKPAELETLGKPMTHEEWAEDYWEHHKFASPNGNDKCDVIQFGHKGFIDFCMAYCVDQKPQDRLVLHDTFGYEKGRQVGQREGVEMVLKTPESYGLYKPAEWSEEDESILNTIIKDVKIIQQKCGLGTDEWNVRSKAIRWIKAIQERFNLQPKQEWSEEDENKLNHILEIVHIAPGREASVDEKEELESFLKSLRPQPHKEIYQVAKHDLAIKFMNFLDENRPEGKMNLSNGECEDLDKAFENDDWATIIKYVAKYQLH